MNFSLLKLLIYFYFSFGSLSYFTYLCQVEAKILPLLCPDFTRSNSGGCKDSMRGRDYLGREDKNLVQQNFAGFLSSHPYKPGLTGQFRSSQP
jgi:hypothetical protein